MTGARPVAAEHFEAIGHTAHLTAAAAGNPQWTAAALIAVSAAALVYAITRLTTRNAHHRELQALAERIDRLADQIAALRNRRCSAPPIQPRQPAGKTRNNNRETPQRNSGPPRVRRRRL